MVGLLPSYQRLIEHASPALLVLNRTNMVRVHTAATIYAVFRSDPVVVSRQSQIRRSMNMFFDFFAELGFSLKSSRTGRGYGRFGLRKVGVGN